MHFLWEYFQQSTTNQLPVMSANCQMGISCSIHVLTKLKHFLVACEISFLADGLAFFTEVSLSKTLNPTCCLIFFHPNQRAKHTLILHKLKYTTSNEA